MKRIAYIALGSNVGDRSATLVTAAKMLNNIDGVSVRKISDMIETEPVGGPPDQEKYLNAAVEIETTLEPLELLEATSEIEQALGRNRADEQRFGPRTCDLDILLMGDTIVRTERLIVPHPRMHERAFVLRPLASIAPRAVHPGLGFTVAQMLADVLVAE